MIDIKLECPICKLKGNLNISEDIIKNQARGIIAVNISSGKICDHSFVAYIDKNCYVRDYFTVDFNVELPQIDVQKNKKEIFPPKDVMNLDLIKLYLSANLLVYSLYCIFTKKNIVIITEQEFLLEHILNFFNYIIQSSFKYEIVTLTNENYKNNKKEFHKKYKNYIFVKNYEIVRDNDNILENAKLKVEKKIIQNFLSEEDLGYSYLILKNEIYKAYKLAKNAYDFYNNLSIKGKSNYSVLNLSEYINNNANSNNFKIHKIYLDFLIEVVIEYFGANISEGIDAGDFFSFM